MLHQNKARAIAFYLPQFHPIPENDQWWGRGFTEWTNVARARPLFRGHHQPQIPADLGFYDLRLEETRMAQAELAREHGIGGFCYYHYWFDGKMLLERPFNEVLNSGKPDFPFCLCWANENWTRAWDGGVRRILMEQVYRETECIDHISWLCRAFRDPRYIKIGGRPLVLIYRTDIMPDITRILEAWRVFAKAEGIPDLYVASVRSNFNQASEKDIIASGFDAIVEFQPYSNDLPGIPLWRKPALLTKATYNYVLAKFGLDDSLPLAAAYLRYGYRGLVRNAMRKTWPTNYVKFPCVTPGWDNTARRRQPVIVQNDDAELYETWLGASVKRVEGYSQDEQIVFINAWNEWAEGCHLEPDLRNGRTFLEATRRILTRN